MWGIQENNYTTMNSFRGINPYNQSTSYSVPHFTTTANYGVTNHQRKSSPLFVPSYHPSMPNYNNNNKQQAEKMQEDNYLSIPSSTMSSYHQYQQFLTLQKQYKQYQSQNYQQAYPYDLEYQRRMDYQNFLAYQQQKLQRIQQEMNSVYSNVPKFAEISNSKEEKEEAEAEVEVPLFTDEQFPTLAEAGKKKKKKTTSPANNSPTKKLSPKLQKSSKIDLEIFKPFQTEKHVTQVWEHNLEEEMAKLAVLVKKYPFIAMDTEFPGVVYQPEGFNYKDKTHAYSYLKANVDNLELIQIGWTISDENGNFPEGVSTWQFNFKFDPSKQAHNRNSINLLKNAGIDFKFLSQYGIDQRTFGTLLIKSGLVLTDKIKWITFHSMFDFGYIIRLLIGQNLPSSESQFFSLVHTFFKCIYDLKHLLCNFTSLENKEAGLDSLARSFNLERVGTAHQAGSDSLLTLNLYFHLLKSFQHIWNDEKSFKGVIFGLNYLPVASSSSSPQKISVY